MINTKASSKPCQTSEMELFVKTVKNENLFTVFANSYILDVWQGSEYASKLASKVKDVLFLNQFKHEMWQTTFCYEKAKRKSQPNFKIVEQKYF